MDGNQDKGHMRFMTAMKKRYFSTLNKDDQNKRAILSKFRSGLTKNLKELKQILDKHWAMESVFLELHKVLGN